MNAAELRIGNLVLFKGNKIKIESVEISYCEQYQGEFNETFKPIKLTEEILLKCGFVQDKEILYRWYLDSKYIVYDIDDGGFKYDGVWIRPLIKHLHQLQNLYFCLIGNELEIKDLEL